MDPLPPTKKKSHLAKNFARPDGCRDAAIVRAALIRRLEDLWAAAEPDVRRWFRLTSDDCDGLFAFLMYALFPEDYRENAEEAAAIERAAGARRAYAQDRVRRSVAAAVAAGLAGEAELSDRLADHARSWRRVANAVRGGGLVPARGLERVGPDRLAAFARLVGG